ncbi:MAG: bifunctional response regulator/alkaline phosphatase family protein [Bacteroidetes bacterium]|nr:bifunctional response regulator/alkaline phosphatase family protein [Bacteroidota bacterium]
MNEQKNILWVDDEINLLQPHIQYLKERGYEIDTSTNGIDAIDLIQHKNYNLILLDEMMPGKDGLATLTEIKALRPYLPVVMVTKNEEETLMEEAIGSMIADYLTKPVNPSQILLVCKKFLEKKQILETQISKEYLQEFNIISQALMNPMNVDEWIELYKKITLWQIQLDDHPQLGIQEMLADQIKECNSAFSKFVEQNYSTWINEKEKHKRPTLSHDVVEKSVVPLLEKNKSIFFIVVDCMRLDQWLLMERELHNLFQISTEYYLSILPTATPFSRNAIFSSLLPSDILKIYPEYWQGEDGNETSYNKYEKELLQKYFDRKKITISPDLKYFKIHDKDFGRQLQQTINSYVTNKLTSIVINFVDMLAHHRSDSMLLKEIAPDEAGYRSLTSSWFKHSSLLGMLQTLSKHKNVTIVLTTDHGSIRCFRGTKVIADRATSTSLRYKFGRNLKCDTKHSLFVKDPEQLKLPKSSFTENFIAAKEDYYFVYPTEYNKYLNQYRDSFQHGGISMEEMILPIVTLST